MDPSSKKYRAYIRQLSKEVEKSRRVKRSIGRSGEPSSTGPRPSCVMRLVYGILFFGCSGFIGSVLVTITPPSTQRLRFGSRFSNRSITQLERAENVNGAQALMRGGGDGFSFQEVKDVRNDIPVDLNHWSALTMPQPPAQPVVQPVQFSDANLSLPQVYKSLSFFHRTIVPH